MPEITRERLNFSMNRKVKWRMLTKRKDGFGREYIVWIDRNSMEPTGQIERHFTVPTPAVVPDEYLKFPEDKPWKVDVLWEPYALYLKKELREWQAIVQVHMKKLYGALGVGRKPTPEALELAGPPPQDWRIIVLASRGDPFLLGFTRKMTPAAKTLLPEDPYNVPTKAAKRQHRELVLDPELEALVGKTKGVPSVIEQAEDEEELVDKERAAQARRLARQMEREEIPDADEDDTGAEAEAELEEMLGVVGGDEDDEGILTGSLSEGELLEVEESADPGAVGGTRVKVGSEKSRAKAKSRSRKTGG